MHSAWSQREIQGNPTQRLLWQELQLCSTILVEAETVATYHVPEWEDAKLPTHVHDQLDQPMAHGQLQNYIAL